MKQTRIRGLLALISVLALPLGAKGQSRNELELGSAIAKFGAVAEIPLTLSTTDQVEGIVAAFDWTPATAGTGVGLVPGPAIATADTVVQRVEAGYMVLGVVMDSDGEGNEIINPGNNLLLATAQIRCGTTAGVADIEFQDGQYATVEDGVLLDNVVVVGGLSIGAPTLILTDGQFECVEGFNRFYIEANAGTAEGQRCGNARVLMENLAPVEGYVVALCHETSELTLDSITPGAAATAAGADFVEEEVFSNGGTLGVVVDLVAPFSNNTIPASDANHIATYRYCCNTIPPAGQSETSNLTFCDNLLGNPLKENLLVIDGFSISKNEGLELQNGTFTCRGGDEEPEDVEICDNGIDDDGDGLIDLADPQCQKMFACGSRAQDPAGNPVGPVEGSLGSPVEVCFYLKSPEDNAVGHPQPDHIQGFSMGIAFCCDLLSARESFDIRGTILEAVGAEFVSIQVDNATGPLSDQDPECEIVIGVLLDTLPPFEGQTIPPLPTFQRVGCVTFDITERDEACGDCCTIDFKDGVKGRGVVPIKNLISTENKSSSPQLMDCQVCIKDKERFFRGDCNFMPMAMGMSVDIADAAAVVSALFGVDSWKFIPPCPDACDCNDDGRLDLADAICILQFLFQFGRFPPAPGPGFSVTNPDLPPGPDPTPDKLTCPAGNDCPGA